MSGGKLKMKNLFVVVVLLAWFVTPAMADYNAGIAAYQRGDYATAFRELKPLAERGLKWKPFPEKENAEEWLEAAMAQLFLALMYGIGQGVPQDSKEELRWLRLAAEKGVPHAQTLLGTKYHAGEGVQQDYKEAMRWNRLAAEQGHDEAQRNLGPMYFKGQGAPQDYVQGHMWFNLSAAQGDANSIKARDAISVLMTPAQIAEAQKLAREWKPKK